ncbi:MFS transporter [Bacillus thermotolerans]|uniref:Major facilitator family transporter n=1 Tax=Bacillus thermotolerans TaxID=1221996 RepID=A0A0F5HTT7_BACTR|nr:MFS transporter [Bacillus thermotolerans]KKB36653.1 major facilitator family transporter [Bacillus thermotolerans]KKB40856.1 major facilitator family transporter [Bacillus thermotolerans]KKB41255.1 major facilitator family transporter [Bacillus thermotolerans]
MEKGQHIWKYAFACVMVTISTLGFGRMSYGIFMPFMKENLNLTYEQAGALGTATAIGYLGLVLFAGIMAAKWGSKRLVIMGTSLVALGLFFLSVVDSFWACLLAMVMLGIGTAFAYTPLVNIIVGWFPEKKGMMIGFLGSGLGLGTLISSSLIPFFMGWYPENGWRYLWVVYGIFSILAALIAVWILKDPPVPVRETNGEKESLFREVYFHKKVLLVAFIYGLIGFAYLIPQSFLFSFMLESQISSHTAGRIMAIGGLMSIFSGPLWGMISDKVGRKKSLLFTLFIGSASVLIPVVFPMLAGFIISQLLWGVTVVGMLMLIQALSTEQIHPIYAPVALGYTTVYFASGQLLGPGLGGWMIDHMGGIPSSLLLCGGLLLSAFLLSTQLGGKALAESVPWQKKRHTLGG